MVALESVPSPVVGTISGLAAICQWPTDDDKEREAIAEQSSIARADSSLFARWSEKGKGGDDEYIDY